jgi:hypothetical protein
MQTFTGLCLDACQIMNATQGEFTQFWVSKLPKIKSLQVFFLGGLSLEGVFNSKMQDLLAF